MPTLKSRRRETGCSARSKRQRMHKMQAQKEPNTLQVSCPLLVFYCESPVDRDRFEAISLGGIKAGRRWTRYVCGALVLASCAASTRKFVYVGRLYRA